MAGGRKTREKRNLIRWNDDLDKMLLLNVQYVFNEAGIRIPWDQVSDLMGDNVSKGAIEQHMSKLRHKMKSLGFTIPPPLRRGSTQTPSRVYATPTRRAASPRSSATPIRRAIRRRSVLSVSPTPTKRSGRKRARKESTETESDLAEEDLDDGSASTDDDYAFSARKKIKRKNRGIKKEIVQDSVEDSPQRGRRAGTTERPTRRARIGRKTYAQYAEGSEDDDGDNSDKIPDQNSPGRKDNKVSPNAEVSQSMLPPPVPVSSQDDHFSAVKIEDLFMSREPFSQGASRLEPVIRTNTNTGYTQNTPSSSQTSYNVGPSHFDSAIWYNESPMVGGNHDGSGAGGFGNHEALKNIDNVFEEFTNDFE